MNTTAIYGKLHPLAKKRDKAYMGKDTFKKIKKIIDLLSRSICMGLMWGYFNGKNKKMTVCGKKLELVKGSGGINIT